MKLAIYTRLILALAGLLLVCAPLHAIKIEIPDQYKDQIEELRAEEQAELAGELNLAGSTEDETSTTVDAQFDARSIDFEGSGAEELYEQEATGNFLLESVDEASEAVEAFSDNLPSGHGLISGQVLNRDTNEPVAGVAILLEGSGVGTITGSDGRYSIGPAPAGVYTLTFVKTGYIESNITEYEIRADVVSVFPFALPPRPAEMSDEVYELQDFTVTAEQANELMTKLELVMNSDSVMSIMSSEDFSKYAASDIGDAVKRVSGVSVVDGKYAVIRGLGDRYVWTTMNGLPLASPDPDKLAVQLDLFPSSLFESIEVSKTFTPDQSATATGALNLRLKSLPEEFFMNVSTSVGFHSIATGNDNFLVNGRETSRDRFAMGANDRQLPDEARSFPEDLNKQVNVLPFPIPGTVTQAQKDAAIAEAVAKTNKIGRNFHNYGSAPGPDYGLKFSFGNAHDLNPKWRLGYFGGVNYSRKFRMIEDASYFRSATETSATKTLSPENFLDPDVAIGYRNQKRTESTATSVLSWLVGFGLEIDENHHVSISRLDLRQSEDENVRLQGDVYNKTPFSSDPDFLDTEISESLRYTERRLISDQLAGKHSFELPAGMAFNDVELDWAVGEDTATQKEPGFVQTRAIVLDSGDLTLAQDSTSPGSAEGSFIIWRDIEEERSNRRLDVSFNETFKEGFSSKIKLGVLTSKGDRSVFDEYITLLGDDLSNPADTEIDASDDRRAPLKYFDELNATGYNTAADISLETEQDGRYIMLEQQLFEEFRVVGGYRHEKNSAEVAVNGEPQLRGAGSNNPLKDLRREGGYDDEDWFPGLAFIYQLTEQASVKVAYSKTIALPSAREVSPYASSAFSGSDIDVGNSALQPSDVENFDLGFSWFNDQGDSFGFTLFHKVVQGRIEKLNGIGADTFKKQLVNPDPFDYGSYAISTFSDNLDAALYSWYNNPNEAILSGIEVEGLKSLGFLHDSLEHFSIGGNFTYIDGEVDRFPIEIAAKALVGRPISDSRALTNQPEYIANAEITYDNSDIGFRISLIAYHISDVLDGVSFVDSYDVYAKAYTAVDLTASKTIGENLKLSLSFKNITDSERGTYYDVEGKEVDRDSYEVGQSISISASYEF